MTLTRGDAFVVLEGEDGFVLNLMGAKPDDSAYPENFHVGLFLEAPDAVRAKHAELSAAGVEVGEVPEPVRAGFASTTFYCRAPGGILVEIGCSPRDA